MSKIKKNLPIIIATILFVEMLPTPVLYVSEKAIDVTKFVCEIVILALAYALAVIASVIFKKAADKQDKALSFSIVYGGVIALIFTGIWCYLSLFLHFPWVLLLIVGLIITGVSAALLFMRIAAKTKVLETDEKIKEKTDFIKTMTLLAKNVTVEAKTDSAKAAATKVYETLRCSDPMSADALADEESQIAQKMKDFVSEVRAGSDEKITALADELVTMIECRNNKKIMQNA